mgnify:CR=1 FL=1
MKVVLPDNSELELPAGATGLDAARAIGPKLAEQAVLVRADGCVQDVRLPLEDGARVQFLTTRDTKDPDALYVLRHSSAHLLAEAVRRLYPGVKIAIGPPIENGFYYDFEFPDPIREEDLEKIQAEIDRELAEGRAWSREEISREEAKKRFAAEGEPYKVELVDTANPFGLWRETGAGKYSVLEKYNLNHLETPLETNAEAQPKDMPPPPEALPEKSAAMPQAGEKLPDGAKDAQAAIAPASPDQRLPASDPDPASTPSSVPAPQEIQSE